ncbi:ASCH domain-containing protein [Palaeococcus ferrophilus]|uniref:ASCH domain-containing protein n=1 Tax=Palaeococcus ferrophilus TaxID=83868 RepID=UPI00064E5314|nr:ASCH domain-containing protein [Palaeococcus ferrophilus]
MAVHVIALHQVYGELIFRGLKSHEIRKSRKFSEGDTVFLYIARGSPYLLEMTLERLGLDRDRLLTTRGTIAGGFEVGEVVKADFETLWELTKDTSGLTLVHGEEGREWLREYVGNYGYAFTIERPFLLREPVSREELRERYGVRVEGIIHISTRTRKPWVRELLEDLMSREAIFI